MYENHFNTEGFRIDASIHTFSCPLAPLRLYTRMPNTKLILCLREPVSRAVSHWKMIRDTEEDIQNNVDWSDFSEAWSDSRLSDDSYYGKSMNKWLEYFPLEQFLIIDSQRMRKDPTNVLMEIENFLSVPSFEYNTSTSKHANSALGRKTITNFGRRVKFFFSLVPQTIKNPLVKILQKRDINIYAAPIISKKSKGISIDTNHYSICAPMLFQDLKNFSSLTNFNVTPWLELLESGD